MECTLAGSTVPPGMEVDEPGKLVDPVHRADQGFAPPVVAMLRAASALRTGEVSGHVGEARGATNDPPPHPHFYITQTIGYILRYVGLLIAAHCLFSY